MKTIFHFSWNEKLMFIITGEDGKNINNSNYEIHL